MYSLALGPTQTFIQWVPGTLSLTFKQLAHEADHPSQSTAEVKNEWNYTSIPPDAFIVCTGTPLCLMMMVMLTTTTVVVEALCDRNDFLCLHLFVYMHYVVTLL